MIDWALLLGDGRCFVSARHGKPYVVVPDATLSTPLELLSFRAHAFLAAHDREGNRRFIAC
jgi:hypothetical protein